MMQIDVMDGKLDLITGVEGSVWCGEAYARASQRRRFQSMVIRLRAEI